MKIKRAAVAAAMAIAAGTATVAAAAPAEAATYGYVYLVTPQWWGWCPNSSITFVHFTVAGISDGGDSGDDVVYARVALNQNNNVSMSDACRWSTPMGSLATIYPTRNNETFWMGYPGGSYHN